MIESNPGLLLCYSCDNFAFHKLRKLCRSIGRKSRPPSMPRKRKHPLDHSPRDEPILYSVGLIITRAHSLKATRSAACPFLPFAVISPRRCNNNCGMSIFTGHTSRHAPHRLEAYGSWAVFSNPTSCGVITAPIGPGYTDPYA